MILLLSQFYESSSKPVTVILAGVALGPRHDKITVMHDLYISYSTQKGCFSGYSAPRNTSKNSAGHETRGGGLTLKHFHSEIDS